MLTRALLPDLIKFSYVPQTELQIHEEFKATDSRSVDYSMGASSVKQGHVLVLEFADSKAQGVSR